ncbi:hypothetical protein [Azospirillum palustre]
MLVLSKTICARLEHIKRKSEDGNNRVPAALCDGGKGRQRGFSCK